MGIDRIDGKAASALGLVLLLAGAPRAASAQTVASAPADGAASTLEAIVVTAQKRSENIQTVPLSIQAVSGEALQAARITDPTALGKLVPSLEISNTGSVASGISVRIRGFGTPGNSATDSDVAAYVDGAYVPRPGTILTSFLDVKNVEVLSGPQGTLFGRNAAMGALSINTNAPTHRRDFDLSVEGGSYGTYAGTGIANLPVGDDLAVRLAVRGSHTDGLYHNDLTDRRLGRNDGFVGRLSFKWDIAPRLSWTLRLDGAVTRGDGIYPPAVYTRTASPSQLAGLAAFAAGFGGTPPVYSDRPSYHLNQWFGPDYLHDDQFGITSDLGWTLTPTLTVRLIDTYRDWRNDQVTGDTIATSIDLLTVREKSTSRAQSHELQLISAKDAYLGGRLGFTAGLYYFHEDYGFDTGFNLGSQFCNLLFGAAPALLAPCRAAPQTAAGTTYFSQATDSFAIYGQVDLRLLPTVYVDLGARESSDRKRATLTSVVPNPLGLAPIVAPEGPEPLRFRDSRPSFRASLSWRPTDRIMAFATYSTGYKSGGFNSNPANPPLDAAQRTFASETVSDYEIGFKSTFLGGNAQLNATFFHTLLHNFQDRTFDGTVFLTRNSGAVRSKGVDIDGRYRASPRLTLTASATYLDAIYRSNPAAPGLEGCLGIPGGCATTQDLSGKPLDYSPKWQVNGGFDWRIGAIGGYRLSLGGSGHYVASFLTANTDNPQSRLPGYATVDLNVGIASPDGRWTLDLFGTNVLDKHYYVSTLPQIIGVVMPGVNDPIRGTTIFRGFLGDPARFGARLSAKF